MVSTNPSFQVLLSCKHTGLFSPIPTRGDVLFCYRCNTWRTCMSVMKAWRMVCRSCKANRGYGVDEARVRRVAIRHLRLNPDHRVFIVHGHGAVEQVMTSGQDPLPIVTDP